MPSFNTLAIFTTSEGSQHGHPDPLNCPEDMTRKSLAWYYYTVERPDTISEIEHSTLYSKRPNKDNFMYKGIIKNNILLFIPPILHKIYLAIKKSF